MLAATGSSNAACTGPKRGQICSGFSTCNNSTCIDAKNRNVHRIGRDLPWPRCTVCPGKKLVCLRRQDMWQPLELGYVGVVTGGAVTKLKSIEKPTAVRIDENRTVPVPYRFISIHILILWVVMVCGCLWPMLR